MRADVFVYLSGPMTPKYGMSIEENVMAGFKLYVRLLQMGIPCYCPHLSGLFPSAWSALSHAEWLAYDLRVIDRCTHVLMMQGWETSAGAMVEKAYAKKVGKRVIYDVSEVGDEKVDEADTSTEASRG